MEIKHCFHNSVFIWLQYKKLSFFYSQHNSETVRGSNLFLASSSSESWELVHRHIFSPRCEVHALLSFTNPEIGFHN
jgi:hypothetical protein